MAQADSAWIPAAVAAGAVVGAKLLDAFIARFGKKADTEVSREGQAWTGLKEIAAQQAAEIKALRESHAAEIKALRESLEKRDALIREMDARHQAKQEEWQADVLRLHDEKTDLRTKLIIYEAGSIGAPEINRLREKRQGHEHE